MPVRTDVGVDALGNYLIVDGIVARDHTVGEILVGRVNARVQHGNAHGVQRTESCFIAHFTHELKKRSGHLRLAHIGVGRHRSEVLGNARRRQLPLCLVQKREICLQYVFGIPLCTGNNQIVTADCLVIRNCRIDPIRLQLIKSGMGSGADQAVFIQPSLHILCGVIEESGKLHIPVTKLRHRLQCFLQIFLCHIPHTVHLNSVFHHHSVLSPQSCGIGNILPHQIAFCKT